MNEIRTEINQILNQLPDTRVGRWMINAFARIVPTTGVSAGSTLAMTRALHANAIVNLDTATGSTCTLPPATGSGAVYSFRVSVLATSNSHIVKCGGSDKMEGIIQTMSDDPATMKGFAAVAGTSTTVTLNRTTTGSVTIGEWITATDVGLNRYNIQGVTSSTGIEATPFS